MSGETPPHKGGIEGYPDTLRRPGGRRGKGTRKVLIILEGPRENPVVSGSQGRICKAPSPPGRRFADAYRTLVPTDSQLREHLARHHVESFPVGEQSARASQCHREYEGSQIHSAWTTMRTTTV